MTQLEIVVRGDARASFAAERALLAMSVKIAGEQRDSVYRDAVDAHSRLVAALEELVRVSAVARWTSQSIHVYSYRPTDRDGHPGDPIFTADISVDAQFHDFDALDRFIDTWAVVAGVEFGGVRWDLEPENRRRYEAEVRRDAVADAVGKAQAYADAVGKGAVIPVQLADPDMLGDARPTARLLAATGGGAPGVALRAEDIELAVAVDARFIAD